MTSTTRPRVLLADDHPGIVTALTRMLGAECDIVEVVTDGGAVAGAAARLHPVVSVVDINLPTVSGLEACRTIVRANPRAKVIVITGLGDAAMANEARAAGASGFVSKLSAGDELISTIKRAWTDSGA